MIGEEILQRCEGAGVTFAISADDKLLYEAPEKVVTYSDLEILRGHKDEIRRALIARNEKGLDERLATLSEPELEHFHECLAGAGQLANRRAD